MWKLKVAGGNDPWLRTLNGHVGRRVWEFDPHLGTQEERSQVDETRRSFSNRRFEKKHCSDLLMQMQFARENPCVTNLPQIKVEDLEEVTEVVTTTLRRGLNFYLTIQAHDGRWLGDYGGLAV